MMIENQNHPDFVKTKFLIASSTVLMPVFHLRNLPLPDLLKLRNLTTLNSKK